MSKYAIYKIQCGDEIYIGSTKSFKQRKAQHKSLCKNGSNLKIYQVIRANGGWDSKNITPIELIDCESPIEARVREEHWRREYGATLNSIRAHSTVEDKKATQIEWLNNNRDTWNNYQREYAKKRYHRLKAAHIDLGKIDLNAQ